MAATISVIGNTLKVGEVRPLLEREIPAGVRYAHAVSKDGQRFLVNVITEQRAASPMTVVVD